MPPRAPIASLPTHDVFNTPPHIGDQDLWGGDRALRRWVDVMGGGWAGAPLAALGAEAGREETLRLSEQANRHGPELRAFDRYGMRLNAVEFHPAYHDLMDMAVRHRLHNFGWAEDAAGAHVAHGAMTYMFAQAEGGVLCPMAMTYSVIPSLATTPALDAVWRPRVMSANYDRRDAPADEKAGALIGMFMTEKQGGTDVRANSTRAVPAGAATGPGAEYALTGHKFFCSAPMCDAFLVLARTEAGVSCFLVPRWRPDGTRNALLVQRMKDKLGNRSNASTEMEFQDTYGVMVGEDGRGIRTIIDMVALNRLYCATSSAGQMRQALAQALHHATHRSVFQKRLIQQPLMKNVLADMAVEAEGALALALRTAKAVDGAFAGDAHEGAMARILTPLAKYWVCKRAPAVVGEALECHGGPGYVEEAPMARMYREAPLNSIWEGSGNVQCLDVLRVASREPEALQAFMAELDAARGADSRLDAAIDELQGEFRRPEGLEGRMRAVTELAALALTGCLLFKDGDPAVAEAFAASRLGPRWRGAFGALPAGADLDAIIGWAAG